MVTSVMGCLRIPTMPGAIVRVAIERSIVEKLPLIGLCLMGLPLLSNF